MKTEVKIDFLKSVFFEPSQCGGVEVSAYLGGVRVAGITAPHQLCVELIDAIQAALENKAAA